MQSMSKLVCKASVALQHYNTAVVELRSLTELLNEVLGLQLVVPPLADVPSISRFCSAMIERAPHPWQTTVFKSTTQWWTVAASLFLFRKRLPSPAAGRGVLETIFIQKMSSPAPPLPAELYHHAASMIDEMFPVGWDKRYGEYVSQVVPSTSASLDTPRASGGQRAELIGSRDAFFDKAFGDTPFNLSGDVRVSNVRDNGKNRLVTVSEADQLVLAPVHSLIYDRISRFPWLLRGDANSGSFKDFTSDPRQVFVSGDYESATDNLNQEFYTFLLDRVLSRGRRIPDSVKEACRSTTRPTFVGHSLSDGSREVLGDCRRGQLMGNLLSFPFLCMTNYIAFKYAVPRQTPVKINGDDIVFRCFPDERDRWFDMVERFGLKVSRGKTLVDERFFSLNSTFFRAGDSKVRMISIIRSKSLFKKPDTLQALTGQYLSCCPGFGGRRRGLIRSRFLEIHSKTVWRSKRAISRDLRMPASWKVLHDANLSSREAWYLTHTPAAPELPLPPKEIAWSRVSGWTRVSGRRSKERVLKEKEYWDRVFEQCWTDPPEIGYESTCWTVRGSDGFIDLHATYWMSCRDGTFSLVSSDACRRRRLLKMSQRSYRRSPYYSRPCAVLPTRGPRPEYYWRKDDDVVTPVFTLSEESLKARVALFAVLPYPVQ